MEIGLNHGKNNNYGFIKKQENKQNTQLFQFNNLNTSFSQSWSRLLHQ
jgi:hypothetical protein